MPSRYAQFDRSRLRIQPLARRVNDLPLTNWFNLNDSAPAFAHPDLVEVASRLRAAKESGAARILMMGAHVIRADPLRNRLLLCRIITLLDYNITKNGTISKTYSIKSIKK